MAENPYEYFPHAQRLLHEEVARRLEQSPELLLGALETIERWRSGGHEAEGRLLEWRGLILAGQESSEGMEALKSLLRDQGETAVHLKSFSPFAGLLKSNAGGRSSFHEF
ncbi:MAG: hypothetical protein HC901_01055 [Bdellovibrionaceae bacterium]|nr:hypothetical protein [Pseudobdellovibrionaceae bacterium]